MIEFFFSLNFLKHIEKFKVQFNGDGNSKSDWVIANFKLRILLSYQTIGFLLV